MVRLKTIGPGSDYQSATGKIRSQRLQESNGMQAQNRLDSHEDNIPLPVGRENEPLLPCDALKLHLARATCWEKSVFKQSLFLTDSCGSSTPVASGAHDENKPIYSLIFLINSFNNCFIYF